MTAPNHHDQADDKMAALCDRLLVDMAKRMTPEDRKRYRDALDTADAALSEFLGAALGTADTSRPIPASVAQGTAPTEARVSGASPEEATERAKAVAAALRVTVPAPAAGAAGAALALALAALENSQPIMKHYTEPNERHQRAIEAARAAIAPPLLAMRKSPHTPCPMEPASSVPLSRMAPICGRCVATVIAWGGMGIGATSRNQAAAVRNGLPCTASLPPRAPLTPQLPPASVTPRLPSHLPPRTGMPPYWKVPLPHSGAKAVPHERLPMQRKDRRAAGRAQHPRHAGVHAWR